MDKRFNLTIPGPHQGQPVYAVGESLEKAQAALMMAHGRGASAGDMLLLADKLLRPGFVFLAPQAATNHWYPNRFSSALESNEPWLTSALLGFGEVVAQAESAGIPPERILLLGFSQGACLALEYAARNPRRYGGVAGLAGSLIGPADAPRDYPGSLGRHAGLPGLFGRRPVHPQSARARFGRRARAAGRAGDHPPLPQPGPPHQSGRDARRAGDDGAHFMTSLSPNDLPARDAYRLLTSLVVPRPIAWLSTLGGDGTHNLAPFSFFNAVAGSPPTVMVSIGQRQGGPKDSLRNIQETGEFVVNLVGEEIVEAMNLTSGEYEYAVDEFTLAGLETAPSVEVRPPRVAGAAAALECRATMFIPVEGSTYTMVLGQVLRYHLREGLLRPNGLVDPQLLRPVGRLAGDEYATLGRVFSLARP